MRPVVRPVYTGTQYKNYKSFLPLLVESFGDYCSYCERADKPDVEHVAPKSKNPALETEWDNLLLGCPRCNRDYKKSKNDDREGYVWPDTHNTFALLNYFEDGRVKAADGLMQETKSAVENTIKLVCLDDSRKPHKTLNLARRRKFKTAVSAKQRYLAGHQTLQEVIDQAEEGLWSVWFTVFQDLADVRKVLLTTKAYPNTSLEPR